MSLPIKVLIIDDSALVRQVLSEGLRKVPGIQVVGTAHDPYMARDKIVDLNPDVLTLDVEMPRMNGIDFLRRLMPQYPIPVIMVSSLTENGKKVTIDALEAGAIDYVTKPTSNIEGGLQKLIHELAIKIKMASTANLNYLKKDIEEVKEIVSKREVLTETTDKIIAIGASTGGTIATRVLLEGLPPTSPGIVIVQHMPPVYSKIYAEKLNRDLPLHVKEAESGDKVSPGKVFIAPGGMHMEVKLVGGEYILRCYKGETVNGHMPSVDILFDSVAKNVGGNAIGVILTGMGNDGAKGMLHMKEAGCYTIAQDKETSVIFGMPGVAIELGGAHSVLGLSTISGHIVSRLKASR